jgi:hypothetical protein
MGMLKLKIISALRWLYPGETVTVAGPLARCLPRIFAARLLKADSHIACRAHATPIPFLCRAVPCR